MKLEVDKIYTLKQGAKYTRYGHLFKIRKITEKGIVCGFWVHNGIPTQHGCIKMEDFKDMVV